jgi:inositol-pentakisphosphate 2-kinase
MPPTPFAPSHATPFKSTLSSSQQPHTNHSPLAPQAERTISVADIDPTHWRYHAEGGKNLLLSYDPPAGIEGSPFVTAQGAYALRIPKSLPPGSEEVQDDVDEAERFTRHVVQPLLGDSEVLPHCIRIPIDTDRDRSVIDTLAAAIEIHRPAARRTDPARIRAESLRCIYAVQDITARAASVSGGDVLCVEIKPKWGFLPRIDAIPPTSPNVDIKTRYSRFRMHAVARNPAITREQFDALYDPLDLYSDDPARVRRALDALWTDWITTNGKTNNLRVFCNGALVLPDDACALADVAATLSASAAEEDVQMLRTNVWTHLVGQVQGELLRRSLVHDGTDVSVLHRLKHLQAALDPWDVEGLAHAWTEHTGSHVLGQLPDDTADNLTPAAAELLPLVQPLLDGAQASSVQQAVQAFLVSASFKDCSLLLRFPRDHGASTWLVDLDRKPATKLAKMQETDAQVCFAFQSWLATQSRAPTPSMV